MKHRLSLFSSLCIGIAVSVSAQSAPSPTSRQIGTAALALAKEFAASEAAAAHPIVRVAPVENDTDLPLRCDKATSVLRSALAADGAVTVAADGATNVDALFSARLKRDGDGYAFAGSIVSLGTGETLWRGNSHVDASAVEAPQTAPATTPALPEMPPADASVPSAIPVKMPVALPTSLPTAVPLGTSKLPAMPSAPGAVPATAAAAALPSLAELGLGPAPEPIFAEGAARTWDEWFSRKIKSVGYHRAGEVVAEKPASRSSSDGSPRTRGYLGQPYFKIKGLYGFYDEHDFHDCKHGKGGGGSAGAGLEISLPLQILFKDTEIDFPASDWILSHTDVVLDGWWRTAVLLPDGYDADGEYWGGDLLLRISAAPGEGVNPYVSLGWNYWKMEEKATQTEYWMHYNYRYGWYAVPYSYRYEESESTSTTTLQLGLELNLTSRFSLLGNWAYYGKGGWNDKKEDYTKSRQVISLDANLRLFSGFFLTFSGAYERDEHRKVIGAGFGYRF